MGLFQKGKSRTWLDDRGWWVCVVEFQPSSWARGTYLNVGCMWLWNVKSYISYDEGNRIEPFVHFAGEYQFETEALRLAERAAEEVQNYRRLFTDPGAVSEYYLSRPPMPPGHWQTFHAAVACAIAGRYGDAIRFFDRFLTANNDRPQWLIAAQTDAQMLRQLASNPIEFRAVISDRIQRMRELQKFPGRPLIDFNPR